MKMKDCRKFYRVAILEMFQMSDNNDFVLGGINESLLLCRADGKGVIFLGGIK